MTFRSLSSIQADFQARVPFVCAGLALLAVALPFERANSFERKCEAIFAPTQRTVTSSNRLIVEITNEVLTELVPGTPRATWPPVVKIRNSAGEITLHDLQITDPNHPVLNAIATDARVHVFATFADGTRRELDLPGGLKKALREYIKAGGPPTVPFDCNCFVHLMSGLPYEYTHFRTRLWNLDVVFDEGALRVADTIVLGYSYSEVKHVAIYLGHGLYISKMGDGPVLVTDFPTLQLGYGGVLLARGRPVLPIPLD